MEVVLEHVPFYGCRIGMEGRYSIDIHFSRVFGEMPQFSGFIDKRARSDIVPAVERDIQREEITA